MRGSVFGYTLTSISEQGERNIKARDLDVVELWSGVGNVCGSAAKTGFSSKGFDRDRVPGVTDGITAESENILTRAGFENALSLVLRVRPGGLLWMAPVCSSFSWLNLKNTQRRLENDYKGNVKYGPVQEGNKMADTAALFAKVALGRGCQVVIENPPGSSIWKYYGPKFMRNLPHQAICSRCAYAQKGESGGLWKQYKFYGSHPWVLNLNRLCECPANSHKRLTSKDVDAFGKVSVTGIAPRLTESAHYLPAMTDQVIAHWSAQTPAGRTDINPSKKRSRSPTCEQNDRPQHSWQVLELPATDGPRSSVTDAPRSVRPRPSVGAAATDNSWKFLRL